MRRSSSSSSIQFLAAAEASSSSKAATMSSRPPYRGGRKQYPRASDRSFSGGGGGGRGRFVTGYSHFQSVGDADLGFWPVAREYFANSNEFRPQSRPPFNLGLHPVERSNFNNPSGGRNQYGRAFSDRSSGGNGGRGRFVTGDSHFQSVRDANLVFRPVENPNEFWCQPRPHFNHPPQHSNPPPHLNHRPPFYQSQQFRPQQQFNPRPQKPLDYRNWEFAKQGPPPHCGQFKVLSYNILADYLAFDHQSKLYFHIPQHMLKWEWRKRSIIFELGLWSADILCFQEVDKFQDLEEVLKLQGYSGIWKMRTGVPVDGCAMFWRVSRFKLLHEECIEFNKLGLRDNVAQICVLELLHQNDDKDTSALPLSLTGSNKVVICNIHVLYNPKRGEIKLGQIRVLLDKAHAVSKLWDDAPVVLCGDFNCTPKSPLYNYISEQKLDLSNMPRNKLSGQASAEIRPPRPFNPNFRAQSADSTGASAVVDHRELRQSGSVFDVPEQNTLETNSVNLPSINALSHSPCDNTELNVCSINEQCGNKNGASSYELTKETHQQVDSSKDEIRSNVSVPDDGLKESPTGSQNKGEFFVEPMKDGHKSTSLDSHHEDIYSNLIVAGPIREVRQSTVDGLEDELHSTVSVRDLKESATIPQNEDEASGEQRRDECEFPWVDSHHEDIYSDLTETKQGEKLYATIDAQCDSSGEQSQPNLQTENESMSRDKKKLSFLSSNDLTDPVIDLTSSSASNSDILRLSCSMRLPVPVYNVSTIRSSENLSSISFADDKDIPSTLSKVDVSCELRRIDFMIDEKMENLSIEEHFETNEEDESLGEDSSKFLSELHEGNGSFTSNFSHAVRFDVESKESDTITHIKDEVLDDDYTGMNSEPVDTLNFVYDPSAWTPTDIETATGNADCTLVEHPLKLRSTYAEVEDCSGTRDANGEPLVTSYNRCFLGTVDYIWRSEGLQTVRVLAPIPKHAMQWTPGFPTKKWGSDHIALVSELAFVKDGDIQNTESP
ncbi:LOW QUALITY PROTEIN: carbon catabolite repressor protein 4 homolog 6 [Actinidia eriantha]|uniref:LOW QUALITY PROTEIN: carbon catabolite repressor protein 4 homolog 6 n=1 Tax=Actinidia eriantha TaxID=165200 RepID=UPI00258B118F|nr:LOW QUALITY PROTEIN: carbon catabolite repressor protein 4 homolog 6 [Actinidia eriantha]